MAADVSSLVRVLSGSAHKEDQLRTVGNESNGDKSTALITRDLLGGSSKFVDSQELDLDLQVPSGWEKRLDLKSGKVYIQKCNSVSSPSMSDNKLPTNAAVPKLQDLNFPPSPSKVPMNLFEESNLELKLVSPSLPSSTYQSVCTLDKVKSALERAEKEPVKKRMSFWKSSMSSLSPSYSSSSSSIKETQEEESEEKLLSSPIAAGCPGCLSYVLIMKNNPKCPRCNSIVPFPLKKKPRLDLNMSI
ncbi:Filamentous hemagglutinin transporter [Quillaja saponaria]|uniref:Filamentous hemagglutinin transporter n=1 Tax=Quillaja saponaria TaxID=32244 RepID=A0AAD7QIA6_QUISA|nr:Filamentous hemagglutinin transporter [Quillaja saponaria]